MSADDSNISFHEPPPSIGSGFLEDLWKSDQGLPRVDGLSLWSYYLKRGLDTVLSLPSSNAVTVVTITVSLFLFSGFLLILQNVDSLMGEAGSKMVLSAYIKEGVSNRAVDAFVRDLDNDAATRKVTYVSKEEALRIFRQDLGLRGSFLEGLDEDNPLPASVDVELRPDELQIGGVEKTVERIQASKVVDEVVYGSEWVQKIRSVVGVVRYFGYLTLCIILLLVVFLISNTIKLVIFSRRDEIGIMQLVGATSGFVQIPFVIGGIIQGLLGAVMSMALLYLVYFAISYELRFSSVFGIAISGLSFLSPIAVIMLICLGVVVGAIGSFFALGRFMNV